jgi:hypothetical protein
VPISGRPGYSVTSRPSSPLFAEWQLWNASRDYSGLMPANFPEQQQQFAQQQQIAGQQQKLALRI